MAVAASTAFRAERRASTSEDAKTGPMAARASPNSPSVADQSSDWRLARSSFGSREMGSSS